MKRKCILLALSGCLLLGGCSHVFDGSYVSVEPHQEHSSTAGGQTVSASNYNQLYAALTELIESGTEESIISVVGYSRNTVENDMQRAINNALNNHPIAAYAVEKVSFELGKNGGQSALAVNIQYLHDRVEIRKIKQVRNMDQAIAAICAALNQCDASIVLQIQNYEEQDFVHVVEHYALENPQHVIEQPQVTVGVYPEEGDVRVVELRFSYQTSRESLKTMQSQVQPVFTSATLYVSGDAQDREKYSQLYSFLMERYDYQLDTSITPAYSLLRHGVGDSRAFAIVYGAMCRQAGLECLTVSGTRNGESRYWNIVCDEGIYYHLDLLSGTFQELTDEQMDGYVWDYSAYPACGVTPEEREPEEN